MKNKNGDNIKFKMGNISSWTQEETREETREQTREEKETIENKSTTDKYYLIDRIAIQSRDNKICTNIITYIAATPELIRDLQQMNYVVEEKNIDDHQRGYQHCVYIPFDEKDDYNELLDLFTKYDYRKSKDSM